MAGWGADVDTPAMVTNNRRGEVGGSVWHSGQMSKYWEKDWAKEWVL